MKSLKCFFVFVMLFYCSILYIFSQTQQQPIDKKQKTPLTRILIIFDASNSMNAKWQTGTILSVAQKLVGEICDSLKKIPNLEVALRIYGHQSSFPPQDCNDTRLEIPFGPSNLDKIKHRLKTIVAKGTTPLAKSLELAANDFPPCDECRNIIILITDGIEECGGDPCAVSQTIQKKGIALKPFVIGIGSVDFSSLKCVGHLYDASSENNFKNVLMTVISQALNKTTAQINLLDIYHKPTESNVGITLYDIYSGKVKYNFMHTLNHRGVPDTLVLDHLTSYRMVVHTLPPIIKDSITLTPGKHNYIAVDAPQGNLIIKVRNQNQLSGINTVVRKADKTINIQPLFYSQKYLIGKYDLEILTIPRIYKEVEISQSTTTTVEIPQPGVVNFFKKSSGYGCLLYENNGILENVYTFDENKMQESLFILPGKYRALYRSKNAHETMYTIEKVFVVEPGKSAFINLF